MGINDEYSRDAHVYQQVYSSDDEEEEVSSEPEVWQDIYSDQLLDGWMHIREYVEDNYLHLRATFSSWNEFVLNPEHYFTFDRPSQVQIELWNKISPISVISDRVSECHFFGWAQKNIHSY